MKIQACARLCFASVAFLAATLGLWSHGATAPATGYAWSEAIGWVNFAPQHGGVEVHENGSNSFLSGHAWAENVGWIKMGSGTGPYDNAASDNWGINLDEAGVMSGYAWSETMGWINFGDVNGPAVAIDVDTGEFDNYAWGENLGWIHVRHNSLAYYVRTTAYASDMDVNFNVLRSRQEGDGVALDIRARPGKTYRVYKRDGSTGASRQLYSTTANVTGTSLTINDTNVVNEVASSVRFYDVVEDDGGTLSTNPTLYATYVEPTATGRWYRLSMPINHGSSNRLDSTLGDMLRSGASGDALAGDMLYAMAPDGSWQTHVLDASNIWRAGAAGGAVSTNALAPGQAFWIKRRSSGGSTNAVYTGPVITAGTPITFASNTWQLIAWPFPTPRPEDAGTNGWGFASAGANSGTSWMTADNFWVDGKLLWLHADGRWRKANGSSAADMQLETMNGYYYLHRGSGFTWTAVE
jgi:hypothetical protein